MIPDLERLSDGHWTRQRRGQLIMELSMWEQDVKEEMQQKGLSEDSQASVMYPKYTIPLIMRTNRVSKEIFFGCIRFPKCRQTMPCVSAGVNIREKMKSEKITEGYMKSHNQKSVRKRLIRLKFPIIRMKVYICFFNILQQEKRMTIFRNNS